MKSKLVKRNKINRKHIVKIVATLFAMTLVCGMEMNVFAYMVLVTVSDNRTTVSIKETSALNIFGTAVAVTEENSTTIIPNNTSTKVDLMVDGKLYKGVNKVQVENGTGNAQIVLEKGALIFDASSLSTRQIDSAVMSFLGLTTATNSETIKARTYTVGDKGKILDINGNETKLQMAGTDFTSREAAYTSFVDKQERLYQEEKANAVPTPADIISPSPRPSDSPSDI